MRRHSDIAEVGEDFGKGRTIARRILKREGRQAREWAQVGFYSSPRNQRPTLHGHRQKKFCNRISYNLTNLPVMNKKNVDADAVLFWTRPRSRPRPVKFTASTASASASTSLVTNVSKTLKSYVWIDKLRIIRKGTVFLLLFPSMAQQHGVMRRSIFW